MELRWLHYGKQIIKLWTETGFDINLIESEKTNFLLIFPDNFTFNKSVFITMSFRAQSEIYDLLRCELKY